MLAWSFANWEMNYHLSTLATSWALEGIRKRHSLYKVFTPSQCMEAKHIVNSYTSYISMLETSI